MPSDSLALGVDHAPLVEADDHNYEHARPHTSRGRSVRWSSPPSTPIAEEEASPFSLATPRPNGTSRQQPADTARPGRTHMSRSNSQPALHLEHGMLSQRGGSSPARRHSISTSLSPGQPGDSQPRGSGSVASPRTTRQIRVSVVPCGVCPCPRPDSHGPAVVFCVACDQYMCRAAMEVHDALPATRQHHRQQQQQQHDTMASSRAAWQQQSMMAAALTTVSPRLLSMGAVSGQQGPASGCRQCHDDQNSRLQQQQAQAQPHDKDDKPREGGNTWQQLARQVAEGKALASRLDKGLLHRLATLENQEQAHLQAMKREAGSFFAALSEAVRARHAEVDEALTAASTARSRGLARELEQLTHHVHDLTDKTRQLERAILAGAGGRQQQQLLLLQGNGAVPARTRQLGGALQACMHEAVMAERQAGQVGPVSRFEPDLELLGLVREAGACKAMDGRAAAPPSPPPTAGAAKTSGGHDSCCHHAAVPEQQKPPSPGTGSSSSLSQQAQSGGLVLTGLGLLSSPRPFMDDGLPLPKAPSATALPTPSSAAALVNGSSSASRQVVPPQPPSTTTAAVAQPRRQGPPSPAHHHRDRTNSKQQRRSLPLRPPPPPPSSSSSSPLLSSMVQSMAGDGLSRAVAGRDAGFELELAGEWASVEQLRSLVHVAFTLPPGCPARVEGPVLSLLPRTHSSRPGTTRCHVGYRVVLLEGPPGPEGMVAGPSSLGVVVQVRKQGHRAAKGGQQQAEAAVGPKDSMAAASSRPFSVQLLQHDQHQQQRQQRQQQQQEQSPSSSVSRVSAVGLELVGWLRPQQEPGAGPLVSVAVDGSTSSSSASAHGHVYVSDRDGKRVRVLSTKGEHGQGGEEAAMVVGGEELLWERRLDVAAGLAVDERSVFVADSRQDKIQVFDKRSGRQVRWLGGGGQLLSGGAQLLLKRPERVVVDGAFLFVSDTGHHRVVVLDKESGEVVLTVGGRPGSEAGQLSSPTGLAVEPSSSSSEGGKEEEEEPALLWVLDAGNARLQAFDKATGYFKRQFPLQGSHASSGSELSQEDGAPRQQQQQPHSLSGGLVVCGDWLVVAGGPMADGLQVYDKRTGRLVATSATAAVHAPKDGHEQQVEAGPALQGAVDVSSAADGSTLFVADGKTSAIAVMRLLVTEHKAETSSSSSSGGGDASAVVRMEVEDRG